MGGYEFQILLSGCVHQYNLWQNLLAEKTLPDTLLLGTILTAIGVGVAKISWGFALMLHPLLAFFFPFLKVSFSMFFVTICNGVQLRYWCIPKDFIKLHEA